MADDGKIVIGIEGNPAGLNKALDDVEKKGQKTAQSVGSAFSAIGGALAGAGIIASFKGAFDAANRLEASLARVTSSAKAFGLSTESAKKAAIDLAKDGFLSLNQSASALSNLMSTGLNIDQSKKFIEASKNIAAFGNTVGDAAGSIESGIKGIITGSSELVENMSPAMKKLSMAFTENKTKVGEAKAVQELYNGVIKLGNQYAGDAATYLDTASAAQNKFNAATEAASAAIGKSLQPMLKGLYNTLSSIVEIFTKWFSGLGEGVQTIIVMIPLVASLIVTVASLGKGMVALGIISASTWAAILGPLTLVIGLVAVLGLAVKELYDTFSKGKGEKLVDERKALEAQIAALEKSGKKTQELTDAKERLAETNAKLVAQYGKYLKALGLENASLETKLSLYKRIDEAERRLGGKESVSQRSDAEIRDRIKHSEDELAKGRSLLSSGAIGKERFDEVTKEYTDEIFYLKQELAGRTTKTPQGSSVAGAKRPEQRFIESQERLKEIELNRLATINRAQLLIDKGKTEADREEGKRRQMRAYQDAEILAKTEINALRSAYAEYIEDKAMADKIALDEQTNAAIRAVRQQEEAGEIIKEEAEKRIQKIRAANIRKENEIRMKSFAETAQAANQIAGGISTLSKGGSGFASGASQLFGGIGALSDKLKSVGMFGQVAGAVMGIGSMISEAFGKSDAERQAEADLAQRQRAEQLSLLELQAGYQKAMLALQEAAAKLPFENLQRTLRLTDIQTQQKILSGVSPEVAERERLAQRREATSQVLQSESGSISGGALFSGTGSTPEELIAFLKSRAAQSSAVAYASQIINSIGNISGMTGRGAMNYASALLNQLGSLSGQIPPELYSEIYGRLSSVVSGFRDLEARTYNLDKMTVSSIDPSYYTSGANSLISEIGRDVGIAENLLSVIEQNQQVQLEISANTKKTADNTSRLTQMRENNVLDLAGGGIRGFGSFFRGAFNSVDSLINPKMPGLSTPSAISNSLSVASLTRSWQDRAADGIENLVKIQTEALRLLAEIALNTDAQGQVQGSMTSAQLQDIMANIRSRIV